MSHFDRSTEVLSAYVSRVLFFGTSCIYIWHQKASHHLRHTLLLLLTVMSDGCCAVPRDQTLTYSRASRQDTNCQNARRRPNNAGPAGVIMIVMRACWKPSVDRSKYCRRSSRLRQRLDRVLLKSSYRHFLIVISQTTVSNGRCMPAAWDARIRWRTN